VECGVAELGDVMSCVIVIVNAPSAVGSSALLGVKLVVHLLGSKIPSNIIASTLNHPSQASGRDVRNSKNVQRNRIAVTMNHAVSRMRDETCSHHAAQLNNIRIQNAAIRNIGRVMIVTRIRLTTKLSHSRGERRDWSR
jgi:hypothetical protein